MHKNFVHSVYFWLKEDHSIADQTAFEIGANTLLTVPGLVYGHLGKPANSRREIIDFSYSYHLLLVFEKEEDHERYQTTDEIHKKFIADCRQYWDKIQIYDSI